MSSKPGNKGVSTATLLSLVLCCCGEPGGLGDGVTVTLGVALIIGGSLFGIGSFAIRVSSMWVWFSTERFKIGEVGGNGLVDGFGGSVVLVELVTELGGCILLLLLPLDDDNVLWVGALFFLFLLALATDGGCFLGL